MIQIISQNIDEALGEVAITIMLPHPREGNVRYYPEDIEEQLGTAGLDRGKRINPVPLCNKPGNPLKVCLTYKSPVEKKTSQKTTEKLDKPSESVTLKKSNIRRKKSGG